MKTKAQEVMAAVEKQYGKGAILELGEPPRAFAALPCGIAGLDAALGGGWPRSGIVEVYGPDTTYAAMNRLALRTIVATQRGGGAAAFIDAEQGFDVCEARRLGVDVGRLLVSQPDSGEQALEIAETLVRSGAIELIVIDAVRSLVPAAVLAGDADSGDDPHLGLSARMLSQGMRRLSGVAERVQCLVLFLNRLTFRSVLAAPAPIPFANGCNSLKFYAKQRVDLRKEESGVIAHVRKNKLAAPFRSAAVDPTPEELAGAGAQAA
jgi:recombination protein RecA